MHLSGNDSTGSFVSCEDADGDNVDIVDGGPCETDLQLPAYLPVLCDVDADTVVMQHTLKLPAMPYAAPRDVSGPAFVCDVDAPTMVLQDTPMLRLPPPNPFAEPSVDCADVAEAARTVEEPSTDVHSTITSPSPKVCGSNMRRSSFLVPLDAQVRVGGISKRRSSCAFALAPLAAISTEDASAESSIQLQDSEHGVLSIIAGSPLPVFLPNASPSPCRITASASKRKTLSAQSPSQALATQTPRRRSLNLKSPAILPFESFASAKSEIPLKIEMPSPQISFQAGVSPLTLLAVSEIADTAPAIAAHSSENVDPNLSKKTPEKKKRRLYNPARIPDALLEE
jgi:hypothetical protein